MTFQETVAADVAYAFEDIGESVTYTPADSSKTAFTATVIFMDAQTGLVADNAVEDRNSCLIQQSDLESGGLTCPVAASGGTAGDTITQIGIDGSSVGWSVVAANPLRLGAWRLELAKDLRFFRG